MAKNLLAAISELVECICQQNGVYLYDVEYQKEGKNQVLRVYIDKDGGINIDECETVSRCLSEELDRADLIATAYNLEVSSPGAERKLTKSWHYEKVLGKQIELSFYAPVDGQKNIVGVLESIHENSICLQIAGETKEIPKEKIAAAKLFFDIAEALKSK